MSEERVPEERLREMLESTTSEQDKAILTELLQRRRESGYNREQRLTFLLRLIKDSFPEVANDLRKIYEEQGHDIYYTRREVEYQRDWRERETTLLRGYLRDAMAFITPEAAGDYKLWKKVLDDRA